MCPVSWSAEILCRKWRSRFHFSFATKTRANWFISDGGHHWNISKSIIGRKGWIKGGQNGNFGMRNIDTSHRYILYSLTEIYCGLFKVQKISDLLHYCTVYLSILDLINMPEDWRQLFQPGKQRDTQLEGEEGVCLKTNSMDATQIKKNQFDLILTLSECIKVWSWFLDFLSNRYHGRPFGCEINVQNKLSCIKEGL